MMMAILMMMIMFMVMINFTIVAPDAGDDSVVMNSLVIMGFDKL